MAVAISLESAGKEKSKSAALEYVTLVPSRSRLPAAMVGVMLGAVYRCVDVTTTHARYVSI